MIDVTTVFSPEEKIMMNDYVSRYAPTEYSYSDDKIDFLEVLKKVWAEKKESLYHLFGDKLILKKEVQYETPVDDLIKEYQKQKDEPNSPMFTFHNAISKEWNEASCFAHPKYENLSKVIWNAFTSEAVMTNKILYGFELIDEQTGKIIRFNSGTKTMKVLKTIADMYDLPGFEDFRLEHSRLRNAAKLKGTLCLSIHPLDYMTMSDNNSDWTSCMSWKQYGCYRRGTVEMMNSPYAVVAYLEGDKDMKVAAEPWNNKRWRSLILLTPQIITSIKNYPYEHISLTEEAVKWLAQLAGSEYDTSKFEWLEYCGGFRRFLDGNESLLLYNIIMTTNSMYNDFGCASSGHAVIPNSEYNSNESFVINYSGPGQCVWCGDKTSDFSTEEFLICYECGGYNEDDDYSYYCPYCGEGTDEYSIETIDGYTMCPYCVEDYTEITTCPPNERHHENYIFSVYLTTSETFSYPIYYEEIRVFIPNGDTQYIEKYLPHYEIINGEYCLNINKASAEELVFFNINTEEEIKNYINEIKENNLNS